MNIETIVDWVPERRAFIVGLVAWQGKPGASPQMASAYGYASPGTGNDRPTGDWGGWPFLLARLAEKIECPPAVQPDFTWDMRPRTMPADTKALRPVKET